ncbi:cytochrome c oxidase subunit 7A2-like, mitochondrial [Babylonia areolata]|uniref:cytochrome c oxidase subunit 7A2-like, mitochondrial n=1 Tax=Babylonia areolata TaxID=304850 RepID=UPI003FD5C004
MYYKYNSFIGRVTPSTQSAAFTPQGLSPLTQQPPAIVFDSKNTKIAHEPEVEPHIGVEKVQDSGKQGVVPSNRRYKKLMEMQNFFLKDDGKLVWQKLGGRDRLGYYSTIGLVMVGTVLSVGVLFRMSFPRKSEE